MSHVGFRLELILIYSKGQHGRRSGVSPNIAGLLVIRGPKEDTQRITLRPRIIILVLFSSRLQIKSSVQSERMTFLFVKSVKLRFFFIFAHFELSDNFLTSNVKTLISVIIIRHGFHINERTVWRLVLFSILKSLSGRYYFFVLIDLSGHLLKVNS